MAVEQEVAAVGTAVESGRDDAREPQRTLFSWAEFMAEEPEEPPRKRRDEAPTLSLFEWALEQEREGALAAQRQRVRGHRRFTAVSPVPVHVWGLSSCPECR